MDLDVAAVAGSTTCPLPGISQSISFIGAYVRNSLKQQGLFAGRVCRGEAYPVSQPSRLRSFALLRALSVYPISDKKQNPPGGSQEGFTCRDNASCSTSDYHGIPADAMINEKGRPGGSGPVGGNNEKKHVREDYAPLSRLSQCLLLDCSQSHEVASRQHGGFTRYDGSGGTIHSTRAHTERLRGCGRQSRQEARHKHGDLLDGLSYPLVLGRQIGRAH